MLVAVPSCQCRAVAGGGEEEFSFLRAHQSSFKTETKPKIKRKKNEYGELMIKLFVFFCNITHEFKMEKVIA